VAASRALVCALVAATLLLPARSGAERIETLRAQAAALSRQEHRALLDLYAAASAVAGARETERRLASRVARIEDEVATTGRLRAVAARSLAVAQKRIATALKALYVDGDRGGGGVVAIVFGAASFDEAVNRYERLRATHEQNSRLLQEFREKERRLARLTASLMTQRASLRAALERSEAATRRLEAITAERRRFRDSLGAQASLTGERIRVLERAAADASRRSLELTAAQPAGAEPGAPDAPAPSGKPAAVPVDAPGTAPAGARVLVVTALAYSLPGRTASGLPVGQGVIAVDPAVIPLGSRVFVPGYGRAVAADTGSAIRGNIIDLWMPTMAQAQSWGSRTVTITIYGS
jgi:3D (Asp-Asp-Asp) domain-containing protein